MGLINFADARALTDLSELNKLSLQAIELICAMCGSGFRSEVSSTRLKRRISKKAASVNIDPEYLEKLVLALTKVFADSAKAKNSAEEFEILCLNPLCLSKEQSNLLTTFYCENLDTLREMSISDLAINLPQYVNASWRLDIEIGSRMLINKPPIPVCTLQLDTDIPTLKNDKETAFFKMNYSTMKCIQLKLENALEELNSVHSSRMQRYIH